MIRVGEAVHRREAQNVPGWLKDFVQTRRRRTVTEVCSGVAEVCTGEQPNVPGWLKDVVQTCRRRTVTEGCSSIVKLST